MDVPTEDRDKGICGVPLANRDVKETNKRTALHIHGQFYGGAQPALLAHVAHDAELLKDMLDAIDTQVSQELPLVYHMLYAAQRYLRVPFRRDTTFPIPEPPDVYCDGDGDDPVSVASRLWEREYAHHVNMIIMNRHTHEHCGTCLHGQRGKTGC